MGDKNKNNIVYHVWIKENEYHTLNGSMREGPLSLLQYCKTMSELYINIAKTMSSGLARRV